MKSKQSDEELLVWYQALRPLRVDLIGDFAGKELFAIHGEALLTHCLSEAKVSDQDGFQLLHAIHAVETFLWNLQRRGCQFHIVWFSSHERICIPPDSSPTASGFYRLTRAILIQHFKHHFSGNEISFQFPTVESVEFEKHLATNSLRFFLCLDGFSLDAGASLFARGHLEFINQIGSRGYSVALIDTFEFKSSKAFASVLPPSASTGTLDLEKLSPLPRRDIIQVDELERMAGVVGDWSPWDDQASLSTKELVSLTGVCNVLVHDASKIMRRCAAAYILHISELKRCSLSERPCPAISLIPQLREGLDAFLVCFSDICATHIESLSRQDNWDVFDLFDSRILRQVLANLLSLEPTAAVLGEARKFAERINLLTSVDILEFLPQTSTCALPHLRKTMEECDDTVLTFKHPHPDLNTFLEPIHVVAKDNTAETAGTSKVFRELSHWHNANKHVDPKTRPRRAGFFSRQRNQKLMADTIAYSASLTNSAGKNINPETIVTGPRGNPHPSKHKGKIHVTDELGSKALCHDSQSKNKKNPIKGGRSNALEEARKVQREKLDSKARTVITFWDKRCREFQSERNLIRRLDKIMAYMSSLSDDARSLIGAEVHLFVCQTLVSILRDSGKKKGAKFRMAVFAKVWSEVLVAGKLAQSTESLRFLEKLSGVFRMPMPAAIAENHLLDGRQLPFSVDADLHLPTSPLELQLEHCGPFLERSFDPAPDARVPNFIPDAWQRKVLDAIDCEKSLFVVAPTSAGKTFISFYAMKQVLQSTDDGILVYVAPTKALVNQIAAEVQARFSKSYHHDGRSVWAIHTRDYRINNPTGCQVLVTVPHILQIMLLAPSNAENDRSWSARVKRIIFDEIHCIGQAEDGVVWEQLLLLAPCPIIALSATVGNPLEFMQWLEACEKGKGRDMEMIVHSSRYSDLRKFLYRPPENLVVFRGLLPVEGLQTPGLDEGSGEGQSFDFIHPIVSLTNRNRGSIDDISLEPRDCMSLWRCMSKHQNKDYPVDNALHPERALPAIVKRSDVLGWGASLKKVLQLWIQDVNSPFSALQQELGSQLSNPSPETPVDVSDSDSFSVTNTKQRLFTLALPMLTDLHARGALPGILFNYDREACEATVVYVLEQLDRAEKVWKESSPEWAKKLAGYEAWKKTTSQAQPSMAVSKKRSGNSRGQDDERLSKMDMMQEEGVEPSKWDSFDPDAPLDQFSFADGKKTPDSKLQPLLKRLVLANVKPKFIEALKRGLAVHHAGMNRNYRQIVEMLFREGYLRVVVATGTLALGINMPCKTVVFFGDSVFLTPLNYHQGSGRAGRRGFDLLGNVVFVGMPLARALEIMSSRLPDLNGHFPLSTTLVVRLLGLMHHTKSSEYATRAMNSILSLSRLYLGGPSDQMAIKHHLRFSIEYLRRQQLLSQDGTPLNFAGLVGHLYFTENAVFAFHSLLKEGYFHRVCEAIEKNPEAVLLELVLVLSHLFCRIPLGIHSSVVGGSQSPSVIRLPPLPEAAESVLQGHNRETLNIFRLYVSTFIKQHLEQTPDTKLPMTGYEVGPQHPYEPGYQSMVPHLPPTKLRSPFAALSGFTDDFGTIHELCATVRSNVFLEESAVPYIPIYPADTAGKPWNAYIYDFFKHGDLKALVRDNKIKSGDVWFKLKDFSLILATIITSLENFVRSDGPADDAAMMDVQDADDADDAIQARLDELQDEEPLPSSSNVDSPVRPAVTAPRKDAKADKKKAVAESWKDEASDDGGTTESSSASARDETSWSDDGNGNLMQVLQAFRKLQEEFETKFRKKWA
ncbi:DEAD DEAH box [Cordyceps militaris]|uniref:DEAD DEAH box n=1 Tax=Cordyceps militaris TaxID=73501 RepID=A0A2H4SEE9_CORMI|nr:DEAD DEAH box [Cordyceps militaris]